MRFTHMTPHETNLPIEGIRPMIQAAHYVELAVILREMPFITKDCDINTELMGVLLETLSAEEQDRLIAFFTMFAARRDNPDNWDEEI